LLAGAVEQLFYLTQRSDIIMLMATVRKAGKAGNSKKESEKEASDVHVGSVTRPKRGRRFWLVLTTVVILVVAGGVATFLIVKNSGNHQDTPSERALKRAQAPPPANIDKDSVYYANLAAAYENNKDYQQALDNYLKADSMRTQQMKDAGYTFNVAIANLYARLGQKDKAKQYYQLEIDRVSQGEYADQNKAYIEGIQKLKDAL
jgi:tetratricopeptide (TPR) repeat protein